MSKQIENKAEDCIKTVIGGAAHPSKIITFGGTRIYFVDSGLAARNIIEELRCAAADIQRNAENDVIVRDGVVTDAHRSVSPAIAAAELRQIADQIERDGFGAWDIPF